MRGPANCRRLRVGAVSYLNTKPLIYRFADFARSAELILDVPSRLADRLAGGDLDVALIPSVESFQHPGYALVSDACIACRGPVLSVKLLSRLPIPEIQTLALDEGSRTSVALVQVLLWTRHGLRPRLTTLQGADRPEHALRENDAVLLIGDRAIHSAGLHLVDQWDLGEQWCQWTGLPFVFAMWTAREGIDTGELELALGRSRDAGLANLDAIARAEADSAGLPPEICRTYLRENLHFTLGTAEQQGLRLFHRYASELGLVPPDTMPRTMRLLT